MSFSIISSRLINRRFLTTYYTKTHEWIKITDNGKKGTVGITDFAQESMGDIVYCDLEEVGSKFKVGDIFGTIESAKASSDIEMPISGNILEVNPNLEDDSSLVNTSAMNEGWLIKINVENKNELESLLTETEYTKICDDES